MNTMQGRFLLKGLLVAAGLVMIVPAGTAQAETWCRRDIDRDNPVCVFGNARDCVQAAAIMGGVCERQQLGRANTSKSCKPSREAGVAGKRRVADSAACNAS